MRPIAVILPHNTLRLERICAAIPLLLYNPTDKTMYVRIGARSITVSDRKPALYGQKRPPP